MLTDILFNFTTIMVVWVAIGIVAVWLEVWNDCFMAPVNHRSRLNHKTIVRTIATSAPLLVVLVMATVAQLIWSGLCRIRL